MELRNVERLLFELEVKVIVVVEEVWVVVVVVVEVGLRVMYEVDCG